MKGNTMTKRANWHDYRSPGRYLITLSKSSGIAPFSTIEGDWNLPMGTRGSSYTRWSPVGHQIADMTYNIGKIHPSLKAEQYVVMPDHVHILLCVQAWLPEQLGFYIARFKQTINVAAGTIHVFEDGFNDQIIDNKRNLQAIFNYIRSNPYRLAVRRAYPDFFTRRNALTIGDVTCQVYGNIHLLNNPFKDQLVVHRADAKIPEKLARLKEGWHYIAENGGALVSPFISQNEKDIRKEAEALGTRLILITHEAFPDRYKPAEHDFALCTEGRLLILSLGALPSSAASV